MKNNPSIFKKINHIGIPVKDLNRALLSYSRGLGIEAEREAETPDVQLKIAVLKIGEIEVELLEYGDPNLPIVKALRGNHLDLNYLCYEIEDFEETVERLMANGFELVEGFPRQEIHGSIAFFVPPHSPEQRIEILKDSVRDLTQGFPTIPGEAMPFIAFKT